MDLSDLRIFTTVVREGGVTRAAEKLNRVQSNVTTRIRQLEEDLGVALFIREGKRLHLAPAGQALLGYADRLLALADEARASVRDPRPRGLFRLGSMESTAAVKLPKALNEYHRLYPEVTLELRIGNPVSSRARSSPVSSMRRWSPSRSRMSRSTRRSPMRRSRWSFPLPDRLLRAARAGFQDHGRIRARLPVPQAAGGLVRQARRNAGTHGRARLLSRDARLRGRRHGHRADAEKRAHDLSGEQAACACIACRPARTAPRRC